MKGAKLWVMENSTGRLYVLDAWSITKNTLTLEGQDAFMRLTIRKGVNIFDYIEKHFTPMFSL